MLPLPLPSSPIFSPTLSPNRLLCLSITLFLCPLSLPLHQSFYIFPYSLSPHSVSHLPLLYFFISLSLLLCPTGVRAGDDISILQVHPHHHGKSLPMLPLPLFCLLFLHFQLFLSPAPPLLSPYEQCKGAKAEKVVDKGRRERWQREKKERRWRMGRGKEREKDLRNEHSVLYKDVEVQRRMAKKWKKKGVWGEGDDRRDVPFFFCHPPPSFRFRCFHLPLWYTPFPFYHLN